MARTKSNESFEILRSVCGDEIADTLMRKCPSTMVYIPGKMSYRKRLEYVTENYDGTNARAVSLRLGVSVTTVKKMLNAPRPIRETAEVRKPYIPRWRED